MNDTFLYLIALRDGAEIKPPVKIGVSKNPGSRLCDLQTACPFELVLVKTLSFPSRDMALRMENCFHVTQQRFCVRGEWFDIPPSKASQLLEFHTLLMISQCDLSDEDKELAFDLCIGRA